MNAASAPQTKVLTPIERYYRFHARIYDATRWSFLFGRAALIERAAKLPSPIRVLEVGCGTGKNLIHLARRFPNASITGVDLSDVMLDLAKVKMAAFGDRVRLERHCYDRAIDVGSYDLVIFSYALSMFNPGWEQAIVAASEDLCEGGHIAVVDFHHSTSRAFRRWMGINHVQMEGHLLPALASRFATTVSEVRGAYGGLWQYAIFIGQRRAPDPLTGVGKRTHRSG